MRVIIAPDGFSGTLTAGEAAAAIAEGWRRHAPDDDLDLCPLSDGGPRRAGSPWSRSSCAIPGRPRAGVSGC